MSILICFGFGFLLALEIGFFKYLCEQDDKHLEELKDDYEHLVERFESMRDYINDNCVARDKVDMITEYLNIKYEYVPGKLKIVKKRGGK